MRVGQKNGLVLPVGQKGSATAPGQRISVTKMLIFSGAVCPGPQYWNCSHHAGMADQPKPCRSMVDEISLAVAPRRGTALIILDKGGHGTPPAKLKLPDKPHPGSAGPPAWPRKLECGGKHLAIPAPDLSLQSRVRKPTPQSLDGLPRTPWRSLLNEASAASRPLPAATWAYIGLINSKFCISN